MLQTQPARRSEQTVSGTLPLNKATAVHRRRLVEEKCGQAPAPAGIAVEAHLLKNLPGET
jgi:hypothetical protein